MAHQSACLAVRVHFTCLNLSSVPTRHLLCTPSCPQVASKVAELAVKAAGKAVPSGVEDLAAQQQQADTPPRSATKAAHIGTRTPDSPELLQCPSADSDRD